MRRSLSHGSFSPDLVGNFSVHHIRMTSVPGFFVIENYCGISDCLYLCLELYLRHAEVIQLVSGFIIIITIIKF